MGGERGRGVGGSSGEGGGRVVGGVGGGREGGPEVGGAIGGGEEGASERTVGEAGEAGGGESGVVEESCRSCRREVASVGVERRGGWLGGGCRARGEEGGCGSDGGCDGGDGGGGTRVSSIA